VGASSSCSGPATAWWPATASTLAQQDGSFTIEAVAPRSSELARRARGTAARQGHRRQHRPRGHRIRRPPAGAETQLLDRFLVLAEANHLDVLIVLNKIDLVDDDVAAAFLAPYETAGYDTLRTSVTRTSAFPICATLCAARTA
jgi:hypothetical protein